MEVRSKVYTYHTSVKWTEQRKGVISCAGKPDIQIATPPEFKGHEGIWSPEDLFVASANVCVMTTFLAVAERAGLPFTSYESVAEGRLELVDGKFQFTVITLKPTMSDFQLHEGESPPRSHYCVDGYCLVDGQDFPLHPAL